MLYWPTASINTSNFSAFNAFESTFSPGQAVLIYQAVVDATRAGAQRLRLLVDDAANCPH